MAYILQGSLPGPILFVMSFDSIMQDSSDHYVTEYADVATSINDFEMLSKMSMHSRCESYD